MLVCVLQTLINNLDSKNEESIRLLDKQYISSFGLLCLECYMYHKNNFILQNIDEIPDNLKKLYRTVWEISQKTVIKMAADRGAFIDQSQSLNIHIAEPNYGKLTSMHFYAWKLVRIESCPSGIISCCASCHIIEVKIVKCLHDFVKIANIAVKYGVQIIQFHYISLFWGFFSCSLLNYYIGYFITM